MVKIVAQPHLHLDDKQQASGSLRLTTNHGNCAYSVRITDAAVKDGDALKGLRLGMKLDDGSLEALYELQTGTICSACSAPCRCVSETPTTVLLGVGARDLSAASAWVCRRGSPLSPAGGPTGPLRANPPTLIHPSLPNPLDRRCGTRTSL